jgi:hypothetical protein
VLLQEAIMHIVKKPPFFPSASAGAPETTDGAPADDSAAVPPFALTHLTSALAKVGPLDAVARASLKTFAGELRQAAAAAGIEVPQPIRIEEGAKGEAVVDPSLNDAARIQALIDDSPTLRSAYQLATGLAHDVLTQKAVEQAGDASDQAYGHATTQAERDKILADYDATISAASTQRISIKV